MCHRCHGNHEREAQIDTTIKCKILKDINRTKALDVCSVIECRVIAYCSHENMNSDMTPNRILLDARESR